MAMNSNTYSSYRIRTLNLMRKGLQPFFGCQDCSREDSADDGRSDVKRLQTYTQGNQNVDEALSAYYVFDYYDLLLYREHSLLPEGHHIDRALNDLLDWPEYSIGAISYGETKRIPSLGQGAVASQVLELVSENHANEYDVASLSDASVDSSASSLSSRPFLTYIIVSITPEAYVKYSQGHEKSDKTVPNSKECYRYFMSRLKAVANSQMGISLSRWRFWRPKRINRAIHTSASSKTWKYAGVPHCATSVYHSLTSGEYCILVKSATPADGYTLARKIRSMGWAATFSAICLECQTVNTQEGVRFLKCSDRLVSELGDYDVVLRMSATEKFLSKFSATIESQENSQHEALKYEGMALFGRYDFSITLTFAQFNLLYPLLCYIKVYRHYFSMENMGIHDDPILQCIADGLYENEVTLVNERILFDLALSQKSGREASLQSRILSSQQARRCSSPSEETNHCNDNDRHSMVSKRTNELIERIGQLASPERIEEFPILRTAYRESLRLMHELVITYSPLGIQPDSGLDWVLFYTQISTLISGIERHLSVMCKNRKELAYTDEDIYEHCKDLVTHLRVGIDSVNVFHKLLQGINSQSMTSPNYEIQTHLDVEKFMLSYSEFMSVITQSHREYMQKKGGNAQKLLPFLVPDTRELSLSSHQLLNLGNLPKHSADYHGYDAILTASAPSFEVFLRMWDALPFITHEVSHSLRSLTRQNRNAFLVKYICEYVAATTTRRFVQKSSSNIPSLGLGKCESYLTAQLADALERKVLSGIQSTNVEEMNYEELQSTISKRIAEIVAKPLGAQTEPTKEGEAVLGDILRATKWMREDHKKIISELLHLIQSKNDRSEVGDRCLSALKNHLKAAVRLQLKHIMEMNFGSIGALSTHNYQLLPITSGASSMYENAAKDGRITDAIEKLSIALELLKTFYEDLSGNGKLSTMFTLSPSTFDAKCDRLYANVLQRVDELFSYAASCFRLYSLPLAILTFVPKQAGAESENERQLNLIERQFQLLFHDLTSFLLFLKDLNMAYDAFNASFSQLYDLYTAGKDEKDLEKQGGMTVFSVIPSQDKQLHFISSVYGQAVRALLSGKTGLDLARTREKSGLRDSATAVPPEGGAAADEGAAFQVQYSEHVLQELLFWEQKLANREKLSQVIMSTHELERDIEEQVSNYSEICADLVMTRILNLSPKGYFRWMVKMLEVEEGKLNSPNQWLRISSVVIALESHYHKISSSENSASILRRHLDKIKRDSDNANSDIMKAVQRLEALFRSPNSFAYIPPNDMLNAHLLEILEEIDGISSCNGGSFIDLLMQNISNIGFPYKELTNDINTICESFAMQVDPSLQSATIEFVLDFYYRNRLRMAQEYMKLTSIEG